MEGQKNRGLYLGKCTWSLEAKRTAEWSMISKELSVQAESSGTERSGYTVVVRYSFGRKSERFIVMPVTREMGTSGARQ